MSELEKHAALIVKNTEGVDTAIKSKYIVAR